MKEKLTPGNTQPAALPQDNVAMRERIEQRAYHLWLRSGGGHGEHLLHWLQAETELLKSIKQEQDERVAALKTRPPAN